MSETVPESNQAVTHGLVGPRQVLFSYMHETYRSSPNQFLSSSRHHLADSTHHTMIHSSPFTSSSPTNRHHLQSSALSPPAESPQRKTAPPAQSSPQCPSPMRSLASPPPHERDAAIQLPMRLRWSGGTADCGGKGRLVRGCAGSEGRGGGLGLGCWVRVGRMSLARTQRD